MVITKKRYILLLLLAFLVTHFVTFVFAESSVKTYDMNFQTGNESGRQNTFSMYFPNDVDGFVQNFSSLGGYRSYRIPPTYLTVLPYPIQVTYEFESFGTSSNRVNPSLKINRVDQGGNTIEEAAVDFKSYITNGDNYTSGTITIPAYQGIDVQACSGRWVGVWNTEYGYNCRFKITYQIDNAAPPSLTGVAVSGVTKIDNKNYTKTSPVQLNWNSVTDSTANGSLASGIDYYIINSSNGSRTASSNSWTDSKTDTLSYLFPADGTYTVTVTAKDIAGFTSVVSESYTFTLDKTPPTGSLDIKSINGQIIRDLNVILELSNISDGTDGSGIYQICFSNDGVNYTEWESCNQSNFVKNWTLAPAGETKTVYVKLRDRFGNETPNSNPIRKSVVVDDDPPVGNVVINNGASSTDNRQVNLTLSASDAVSMKFSNDGENYSGAEPYSTGKSWILSEMDGLKTVYVKFGDNADNWSTASATIYYDQDSPTGTITINNGAIQTSTKDVILNLHATEGYAIVGMRFSNNNFSYTNWESYNSSKSWTLSEGQGQKTVCVQYMDHFDHISTYSDMINLVAPTGTPGPPIFIFPSEGLETTPGKPLNLSAYVYDPDGDALSYRIIPYEGAGEQYNPEYSYDSTRLGNNTLTLHVTDTDENTSSTMINVNVHNTTCGALYMNEVWTGLHRLTGDVIVPAGKNLIISPGTTVEAARIPDTTGTDYAYSLLIKGSLNAQCDPQSPISFISETYNAQSGWKGIRIEGNAILYGVTIKHAERGVAVINNSAQTTITNCSFQNNYAGIHIYGVSPVINTCKFENNIWFGVKEDEGCNPVVNGCAFTGNNIDYYRDPYTSLTMDQLNQNGNSGNHN